MRIFNRTKKLEITAPVKGNTLPLKAVPDETFSTEILGQGIALLPDEETIVAPCDGTVDLIFETSHAVNLICEGGVELLIHIGVDTVNLKGKHFTSHVSNGDQVKKGDLLITFERENIIKAGYSPIIPIVVCSKGEYSSILPVLDKQVNAGDTILILGESS